MKVVNLKRGPIIALASLLLLFIFISYTFFLSPATESFSRDVRQRSIKDERIGRVDEHVEFPGQPEKRPVEEIREQKEEEPLQRVEAEAKAEKREEDDPENVRRQEFVKEMARHAWWGYRNYTWGANEIRPLSKTPNNQAIFGGAGMGATIVDAADTLWIMDLKEEYQQVERREEEGKGETQARDWIKENFTMSKATGTLSVFETTIRFVGGLLSLRALTGEKFYGDKAREVAEVLLPAFNTPTGLSYSNLNVKQGTGSNYGWANGGSSILAEFGSLHLEFLYLSEVTGQGIFAKKVKKIRDVVDRADKRDGLYSNYMNPSTGKWQGSYHVSVGALGDSFYEYLIKSWLQSDRKDDQARRMYWEASAAIQKNMVFTSKSGLRFVGELKNGYAEKKMGHLACFVTGMFALEAKYEKNLTRKEEVMKLAEDIGSTCHESYVRSASHIGPEMFYFNEEDDATSKRTEHSYILRPEVLEGYFYLWRITGKQMYRDWMWDAVSAMNKHCRVEAGFTGLQNVYNPDQGRDDVQQSFFMAETLKYAYLTFAPSSVVSLDEWVFNTEAHPLPISRPSPPSDS